MTVRPAEVGMVVVLIAAAVITVTMTPWFRYPQDCSIPIPPINLRALYGDGEVVFLSDASTFRYSEQSSEAPVSHLRFELAEYQVGDNHLGPGTVLRSGPLGSLNRTGSLQFHDVSTEDEFSPGSDFLILMDPHSVTAQLRILAPLGQAIAWNQITGCV